jgi:HipA-like C-terminal domain
VISVKTTNGPTYKKRKEVKCEKRNGESFFKDDHACSKVVRRAHKNREAQPKYSNRIAPNASLEELLNAVDALQAGQPLSIEISSALFHGTSLGGARPKAFINTNDRKYIAKFSTSNDHYSVVRGEVIAMRLAKQVGLNVANVEWKKVSDKDVLIVERFDRLHTEKGWNRKSMISGLTLLGLDEMMARCASYQDLAKKSVLSLQNQRSCFMKFLGVWCLTFLLETMMIMREIMQLFGTAKPCR